MIENSQRKDGTEEKRFTDEFWATIGVLIAIVVMVLIAIIFSH